MQNADTGSDPPDMAVGDLVAELMPQRPSALGRLFRAHGRNPPLIQWSPAPEDAANPLVRRFAGLGAQLPQTGGRIRAADFDMDPFRPLHDWMLRLDVEPAGKFRYSYYGAGIAALRGLSMTGRTTEVFGGYITPFFDAVYRAVVQHRRPVRTVHEPPATVFARNWERLILPLYDDARRHVTGFAAITVPDNELRPGLEVIPDPVLIADDARIVRYANRPAREMFGQPYPLGSNIGLFAFSGIDIDLPTPPAELARERVVRDTVSLALRGTMIERFHVTVSGTVQRGRGFYVITLRPAA